MGCTVLGDPDRGAEGGHRIHQRSTRGGSRVIFLDGIRIVRRSLQPALRGGEVDRGFCDIQSREANRVCRVLFQISGNLVAPWWDPLTFTRVKLLWRTNVLKKIPYLVESRGGYGEMMCI